MKSSNEGLPRWKMAQNNWKLHIGIVKYDVTAVLSAHGKFGESLNTGRSRLLSYGCKGPNIKPTTAP